MENQIILETKRLVLKSITPKIITEIFKTKTEAEIIAYFETDENGFSILKDMNEKGAETYQISHYYFLLINKETNKIIGDCGFHTWNKKHKRAELFYNLKFDSDKRKGLMTEALAEVLNFGFNNLELHRIQAMVADYNIPSVKLLNHFHFQKEGICREDYRVDGKNEDSVCYSLLKTEWKTN